jgi:cell division protein FtsW
MLYSASWNESYIRSGGLTESLFLEGHLKRIILGFFCLFLFFLIDYKNLKLIAPYFLTISIALLIMTKGYYLIRGINSPARWLHLSGLSIQTSDVARLSLIIFLAYYLDEI